MRSNSRAGYKIFEVKILFINLRILSLTGKKIQKVKTKCQNLSTETKPLMLELKTSILFFWSYNSSNSACSKITILVSSAAANSIFESKIILIKKIVINHHLRMKLRCIPNPDFCNGRSLIHTPARVLIQTPQQIIGGQPSIV